jgi:L-alanine-DL-glutamate epimerase-like enolase superfamily enzyme
MRQVHFFRQSYRLIEPFVISRGARTHAEVIECQIAANGHTGCGECTPYKHYNETPESVLQQLSEWLPAIEAGLSRHELEARYPAGAARHAVDSALWDLEAKMTGIPIWQLADLPKPKPLDIAMTLSVQTPAKMAQKAIQTPLVNLKLKCAGDGHDLTRIMAVRQQCPKKNIMVDANESWSIEDVPEWLNHCAEQSVFMVEQPIPKTTNQTQLPKHKSVLLCADESCHTINDLDYCQPYDVINIKLDKTGGLTHAIRLLNQAKQSGFKVMVGCMLGSELAIRDAFYLAQVADIVDLDAPLLLSDHHSHIRFGVTNSNQFDEQDLNLSINL